jgi:hypothetical protein
MGDLDQGFGLGGNSIEGLVRATVTSKTVSAHGRGRSIEGWRCCGVARPARPVVVRLVAFVAALLTKRLLVCPCEVAVPRFGCIKSAMTYLRRSRMLRTKLGSFLCCESTPVSQVLGGGESGIPENVWLIWVPTKSYRVMRQQVHSVGSILGATYIIAILATWTLLFRRLRRQLRHALHCPDVVLLLGCREGGPIMGNSYKLPCIKSIGGTDHSRRYTALLRLHFFHCVGLMLDW